MATTLREEWAWRHKFIEHLEVSLEEEVNRQVTELRNHINSTSNQTDSPEIIEWRRHVLGLTPFVLRLAGSVASCAFFEDFLKVTAELLHGERTVKAEAKKRSQQSFPRRFLEIVLLNQNEQLAFIEDKIVLCEHFVRLRNIAVHDGGRVDANDEAARTAISAVNETNISFPIIEVDGSMHLCFDDLFIPTFEELASDIAEFVIQSTPAPSIDAQPTGDD